MLGFQEKIVPLHRKEINQPDFQKMNPQKVVLSDNLQQTLTEAVMLCERDRTFILVDETTEKCCLPLVSGTDCLKGATTIVIGATDANKTIESLAHVWE